jgi:hypothetical protein
MITLRPEQRYTVDKAKEILSARNIVCIAAWMRTGKSIMGITTAYECGYKSILVLSKKNAVENIKQDVRACAYPIKIAVTNHEQAKKYIATNHIFDLIIVDESNEAAGAFPTPTKKANEIKQVVGNKPLILMTGTPTPDSWSQIYHQFWLSAHSPFRGYKSFYKWGKDYLKHYAHEATDSEGFPITVYKLRQKWVGGFKVNDYSEALIEKITPILDQYAVYLSQKDAGFTELIEEEIIEVPIDTRIYKLMDILKKDQVYTLKSGDTIVCDTPVKMQSVFHQLSSGTIKISDKISHTLDESKAWYIKTKFAGAKIAIFYKFVQEFILLKKVFPDWTDDDQMFNRSSHLTYLKQIRSGRSGIDLQTADYLVMYNIDHSATSYWQGRERMANKNRTKKNKMFWAFSEHGFERKVYNIVVKKQAYTVRHFKNDLKNWSYLEATNKQLRIS